MTSETTETQQGPETDEKVTGAEKVLPQSGERSEDSQDEAQEPQEPTEKQLRSQEAAKYRRRAQDAEKTAQEATEALQKLQAEHEQLRAKVDAEDKEREHQAMLARVAETTGLDPELIELLRGETEDELTKAAQRIRKAAPPSMVVPGQAKHPEDQDTPHGNAFADAFRPKP